jgi:hypothetical protein
MLNEAMRVLGSKRKGFGSHGVCDIVRADKATTRTHSAVRNMDQVSEEQKRTEIKGSGSF